jgi:tetratricopeptide (TPR) repeat protein
MREFMAAVTAQPSLNEAHHWLGILLLHLSMFEESTKCFDRALAISPHDRIAQMHTGYCAYLAGRFEDALAIITESGKVITSAWTLYSMALAQIQLGLLDAADRTTEEVSRRFPGDVLFYPLRALSFALRGNHEHARQQIELTIKNEKAFGHYHHAQYDVACVYAQLGEADQAIEWLSEAGHNGFPCAGFFERDPLLQPIHSDERFRSLIADMTEECARYAALYHTLVSAS